MNLIIDIGNSRVKVAIMDKMRVVHSLNLNNFDLSEVERLNFEFAPQKAIICSTRGEVSKLRDEVEKVVGHCIVFDTNCRLPIRNSYATPETLGRDRLAAAVGASILSTADNQLIVDMGTAITIDLVTRDGGFEGGVISPGVMMRFRALNEFTAALPLCAPTTQILDVARSTNEAIEQGVMGGISHEIWGNIEEKRKKYDEIEIIFAGGDLKYFENRIKNTIFAFASSELVFVGLNRILEYNA